MQKQNTRFSGAFCKYFADSVERRCRFIVAEKKFNFLLWKEILHKLSIYVVSCSALCHIWILWRLEISANLSCKNYDDIVRTRST